MKSTYYTGYEDLDKELHNLYNIQTSIEASARRSRANDRIFGEVIAEQDALLNAGNRRDRLIRQGKGRMGTDGKFYIPFRG